MLHYASAAAIVLAGGWLGIAMANSTARRTRALDEMLVAARWLETHILVECMVLPLALRRIRVEVGGAIGDLCEEAGKAIQHGATPESAWPLDKPKALLPITGGDWALWRDLVAPLGGLPFDAEKGHMEASRQRLEIARGEAERDYRRNAKLWRTLGFVGGAAAALLLL